MAMLTRKVPTDRRLWLALSLAAFVAGGFWLEVPLGKDQARYWWLVGAALTAEVRVPGYHILVPILAFWGLFLAIPCAVPGWIAQAICAWVRAAASPPPANPSDART